VEAGPSLAPLKLLYPNSPQFIIPRYVLAELQRLPIARPFPPNLQHCRYGAPSASGLAAHNSKLAKQAPLDPTAHLLMEAANQLSQLVKEQVQRHALRAARRQRAGLPPNVAVGGGDSNDDDTSEDDHAAEGQVDAMLMAAGQQAQQPRGRRGGGCATDTAATSAASGSIASACGSGNAPSSVCLPHNHEAVAQVRLRLQRQYAANLPGQILLGERRIKLPLPDTVH
jgi:hypothetical protein